MEDEWSDPSSSPHPSENSFRRERTTFFTASTAAGRILYGTISLGCFVRPSSSPRRHATRNSELMWMMLIPAAMALRRSSSLVPNRRAESRKLAPPS